MGTNLSRLVVLVCVVSTLLFIFSVSTSQHTYIAKAIPDDIQATSSEVERISGINASSFEIGTDFRLSTMGMPWQEKWDAVTPSVAYNSQDQIFLVVWSGDEDIDGEYEIWGVRVNSLTGEKGIEYKISTTGYLDDDDPNFDAEYPDIVYNPTANEFLVVWQADHYYNTKNEIFARRLSGSTGTLLGTQFRISLMEPLTDTLYDANEPAVAYNSVDNEYVVGYEASTNINSLVSGEFEIWARRLSSTGAWIGDQRRISDMGGTGDSAYDAADVDICYNPQLNQYLVVWRGSDNSGSLAVGENEIWGQRILANMIGTGFNDFRISDMGSDGDATRDAYDPGIAYDPLTEEYLVVWEGDNVTDGKWNIHGQLLDKYGSEIGDNDIYISSLNGLPNNDYSAINPSVALDTNNNEYFVVWQDDELGNGEYEVWGQNVNYNGDTLGPDVRLSDMGPDGDPDFDAQRPVVVYSDAKINQFLVVWDGDDFIDGEFEIWGQRFTNGWKTFLPVVMRN